MKKFLNTLCAVAMGALALLSCDPIDQPTNEPGNGNGNEIVIAEGPEAIMRPDLITPVDYIADKVEAGEDGVSVYVVGKETNNFKFIVRPGASVQSYRLDVYPLCRLYNSLYESAKNQRLDFPLNKNVVESLIRGFIFDSSGAGAYTFSTNNMEDFLSHEFDWMNTPYAQAKVVPDCEYVVAVVGCFDTEGAEQGDLTLCYIRTPYHELVGNPKVKIQAETGYTRGLLRYSADNDDVKYYYQWCSDEADLQPYIDAYGDKLYIDFMRNAIYEPTDINAPIDANGIDPHMFSIPFGMNPDPNHNYMATAIGLDANFTPAKEFQSVIFQPKARPEDTEDANVVITVPENRIAASAFWVECQMPVGCGNAYMSLLEAEEAAQIMQYNEEQMAAYALEIQAFTAGSCWGFTNWNYQAGGAYTAREPLQIGKPDTEYYIAYTGMNQYMELAPVKFFGPFRTKALTTDAPEQSTEDMILTMSPKDANKVTLDYDYTIENSAAVHFQFIVGFGEKVENADGTVSWVERGADGEVVFTYPNEQSSREDLLNYLYYDFYTNRWIAEERGHMTWTDVLQPDSEFGIAYVVEDWNGVLGEVKFAYTRTGKLQGGENPVARITGKFDETTGEPYFYIEQVQDCWGTYYLAGDSGNQSLGLNNLGDKSYFRNEKAVLSTWYDYCMEYKVNGAATLGNPIRVDVRTEKEVALCIPLGGTPDNLILGDMVHLIYDNGEWRTLDHWYPKSSAPMMSAGYGEILTRRQLKPQAEPSVSSVKVGKTTYINVDYAKFSAHPKASGR